MSTYMQYENEDGQVFRWRGGEYIEVGSLVWMLKRICSHGATCGSSTAAWRDDPPRTFIAEDVINVWDYGRDAPMISRTLGAFQARCDEYVRHGEAL